MAASILWAPGIIVFSLQANFNAHEIPHFIGNEKCARTFFLAQTFWTPPRVRDIPAKFPGHPRFLSSKPKEDKLSRAGTNFSATTPRVEDPHPTRRSPDPKVNLCALFSCLILGGGGGYLGFFWGGECRFTLWAWRLFWLFLSAPKSHNRNRKRFLRWRGQIARNPAEKKGFGARKSQNR